MSILYERLSKLCEECNITPYKMAKENGISQSLMTELKMERRDGVSAKTANKLASYFGVSVGYLLGTDDEKTPPAKAESVQYTDMELLEAFRSADERTRDAIRMLLGIKEGK